MRPVKYLAIAALLTLPVGLSAAEWFEYTSKQDLFQVVFPEQPKIEDLTWKSEYGLDYPARRYTTRDGASVFSVLVVDFTNAQEMHRQRAFNNNIFDQGQGAYWQLDVMSSMAFVATQYRRRPGVRVTEDAFHYIDLVAGHQLNMTNADNSRTHVSMYLHKNRLYVLEGTVPPRAPAPSVFTESLQFNDPNGRRVRYQMITHNELPPQAPNPRGGGPAQQYPAGQGQPQQGGGAQQPAPGGNR